jgi:hypothetical protein
MNKILIFMMVMMISMSVYATEFNGYGQSIMNYDSDGDKLSTDLTYLAFEAKDRGYNVYATYDFDNSNVNIVEAYAKFKFTGMDVQVGRMVRPFGINFLDRPESSVFITVPKYDSYAEGVNLAYEESYFIVEGFYSDDNIYDFRVKLELFNDGIIPSLSYNSDKQFLVSNELYYESLVFNYSNLTEWNVDTGFFWTRSVISPGIFDVIGIMVSYYDTIDNNLIPDYNFTPDAWTIGGYLDLSDSTTLSTEYKLGESLTPLSFGLTTKF